MTAFADAPLRFAGRFELQRRERRLLVDGVLTSLGGRAFDLLRVLAERPDRLVTKQELLELVWPDLVVEENNIQQHVSALRKVLGPHVIETVPGCGYRFVAPMDGSQVATPVPRAAAAPIAPLQTRLPATPPRLIGRDADLAAAGALIDRYRLVTIAGPGGIGKSRLAQALLFARQQAYQHGVCLVDLSVTREPASVPATVAGALGVNIGSGNDATDGLIRAIAPLSMLIAIDNAEHVVAAVAALAEAVHANAAGIRLVVTSQLPLKAVDEQTYRLGPLALPPTVPPAAEAQRWSALALFDERTKAVDRRFALTDDNVATVVEVCRSLGGEPLPIELAAARVPLLGLPRLAASLEQRLRVLTSGSPTAPARQQTLRAALEWSHGLLGDAEQKVFRRLAVFVGSASLEAAQHVAADERAAEGLDEWAVLDALGALVDRSLVAVVGASDRDEAPRYRLLDTPRAFALERLQAAGETARVRQRHAQAMRARFEPALDERYSGTVPLDAWRRALEPDCDDACAAVEWAVAHRDPACALAIVPALQHMMIGSLRYRQCAALWKLLEPLLDAPAATSLSRVLLSRAVGAYSSFLAANRPKQALQRAQQAVQALRGTPDRVGLYIALGRLSWPAARLGELAVAKEAIGIMQTLEDPNWPAAVRVHGAEAQFITSQAGGEFERALHCARQYAQLARTAGRSNSVGLIHIVDASLAAGRADEAADAARRLIAQIGSSRELRVLSYARLNLAAALLAAHKPAEAREVAQEGWPHAAQFGMQALWADHLALLAALEARPHAAARLTGYADALYRAREDRRQVNETKSVQRATHLAREALGDDAVAALNAEGAALSDADAGRLALANPS